MMPLAALVTKFGGRLPAEMLQADGRTTTLSTALVIKFGGGLPARMLLADGGTDDAFDGPGYQVWWTALCGDATGRQRHNNAVGGALATKFGSGIPSEMLLSDEGPEDVLGGSGHQDWRQAPCGDAAAQQRHNNAIGGPCHQVWQRAPCWDAAG